MKTALLRLSTHFDFRYQCRPIIVHVNDLT
jgi:hypothetical protein